MKSKVTDLLLARRAARPLGPIVLIAVAVFLIGLWVPHFATFGNLIQILIQASFTAVVAFGMTLVIVTGGIDLSVGGVISLVGVVEADLFLHDIPWPVAVLAGLATGAASGTVSGLVVGRLKLPPFIATFGTFGVTAGLALYLAPPISETISYPGALASLGSGSFVSIPYLVFAAFLVLVVVEVLYGMTHWGVWLRATGDALPVARLRSVPVPRVLCLAYIVSGLCAAIAGTLLAAYLTSPNPEQGGPYTLWAIAACVIGGVDLSGARGKLWAAGLGAVFLAAIQNALALEEVQPFYSDMVTGLLIIVAVVVATYAPLIRKELMTALGRIRLKAAS